MLYNRVIMGITIFGDSVAVGHWDEEGGWVSRLAKYLSSRCIKSNYKEWYSVHNFSVSGAGTGPLLDRFPEEAKALGWGKDSIFIFSIGLNDSVVNVKTGETVMPIEKFKRNLDELSKISLKHTPNVVFMSLTPVDDNEVNPMPWNTEIGYQTSEVLKFNQVVKEFSAKNSFDFINTYDLMVKEGLGRVLEDGAHPSSRGHELIFEAVKNYLLKKVLLI